MDTDGLLLNFGASTSTAAPRQDKVRKGPWKERFLQNKRARRAPKAADEDQAASPKSVASVDNVNERPKAKVQPVATTIARPSSSGRQSHPDIASGFTTVPTPVASTSRVKIVERPNKVDKPSAPRKTYISSLFSSLPEVAAPTAATQVALQAPTNAPGKGSFGALGLSDQLERALRHPKMAVENPTPIQKSVLAELLTDTATIDRDVIIQAQTGSGKTLAFLLPIIQDLFCFGNELRRQGRTLDRSIGTMVIILAPTRELAAQIYDVAARLSASTGASSSDGVSSAQGGHLWLTPGLLSGGMHRQHEKARLRKGIPLVIGTTTEAFRLAGEPLRVAASPASSKRGKVAEDDDFDIEDQPFVRNPDQASEGSDDDEEAADLALRPASRTWRSRFAAAGPRPKAPGSLRWLVFDEADRLMDMGFEPQIRQILKIVDARSKAAPISRRNVLCSATMQSGVTEFAETALRNPITLCDHRGGGEKRKRSDADDDAADDANDHAPPAQLAQHYVVAPLKLRFVGLVALLRRFGQRQQKVDDKVLVFVSCTAVVDYLWAALAGLHMGRADSETAESTPDPHKRRSPILLGAHVFRLHGNMEMTDRLASLRAFAGRGKAKRDASSGPSILICTSVAARGLDIPFVGCVVQYDLPTEGGTTEYVHRVGRTARAGRLGEAWAFLAPTELEWVPWATERMMTASGTVVHLRQTAIDDLLKEGFGGGQAEEVRDRATDVQMAFERWVERAPKNLETAKAAFGAHVRAYATHPSDEKAIFNLKSLHLGYLAKAFGLREAPSGLGNPNASKRGGAIKAVRKGESERARTAHGKGMRPATMSASEFNIR